ncbi:comEB, partial [Symbiodinium sp. KB8]
MQCGLYGAVLSRAPQEDGSGRRIVEILGLAMHYPPKFEVSGSSESQEASLKELTGMRARTLHAEVMLVARCAREGIRTEGAWLYCLQPPCWNCIKAVMMAGITRIVFQESDAPKSFDRQREVVADTGAEWCYQRPSAKRQRYLRDFQQHWAAEYLPSMRADDRKPMNRAVR